MGDCDFDIIERMGGTSRFITVLTFFIHFIHPLFCIANYCRWVKYQKPILGSPIVDAYLAMSIIAAVSYLFVASVFYMWAWRFPEPEEVARRRRIYGITVNLLLSDIPMFVIEVTICWRVQFADGVQGTSFVITCISLAYSALRVWTFLMIKLIKVRAPVVGAQPHFAGSAMYAGGNNYARGSEGYSPHPAASTSYYGNSAPQEQPPQGVFLGNQTGGVGEFRNGTSSFPHEDFRYDRSYNGGGYQAYASQYSPPARSSNPRY